MQFQERPQIDHCALRELANNPQPSSHREAKQRNQITFRGWRTYNDGILRFAEHSVGGRDLRRIRRRPIWPRCEPDEVKQSAGDEGGNSVIREAKLIVPVETPLRASSAAGSTMGPRGERPRRRQNRGVARTL